MRFKRVFLSPMRSMTMKPHMPNVGLGYLCETLRQSGVDYDLLDMLMGYTVDELTKKIAQFQPDLIGFSMMTAFYKRNYEIIAEVKRAFPDIPIVVGGAHAATFRTQILTECPAVDYVVMLEGEQTIVELCKGLDERDIAGLAYRREGEIVANPDRRLIQDLDDVAFPTYHKFELSKYVQHDMPLSTSRGCPYSCIFCTVSTVLGKKVRARSPEKVVDEIEYWVRRGYTQFAINDDNFTFYRDRVIGICEEIERRKLPKLEFRCHNGIRADKVDFDLLKRMKHAGFDYVQISAEGGNDKILRNMKKNESIEDIKRAIEAACAAGMEVQVAFVIGTPGETWQDLEESFVLARKYPVWRADWNHLYAYPGTELYRWAVENNYFIQSPDSYLNEEFDYRNLPAMETPELSREERIRASEMFKEINKELRRKAAARKLGKLGLLAQPIAYAFASGPVQHLWYQNRTFRLVADRVRRAVS